MKKLYVSESMGLAASTLPISALSNGTNANVGADGKFSKLMRRGGMFLPLLFVLMMLGNVTANACTSTIAINATTSNTICAGTSVTFTAFITNGGATPTYQWYKNNLPVGTNQDTYTDNTLVTNDVIKCELTNSAGCTPQPAASNSITFTVNPIPTVNSVANQAICHGGSTTAITFSGTPGGAVFNWSNNTTSIGLAATGTGNIGAFATVNGTNAPVVATVTVTPTYTSGGVTCTGSPTSFTITDNPIPTVNAISNQAVCNGTATTTVTPTGSAVAGTVYNWTNNLTSIGLSASGVGSISSFTPTNATNTPAVATIVYTPVANGCSGSTQQFTITDNPIPTVNTVSDQTICNNAATSAVTFSGFVGTTTYNWTNNTPSIGLAATGSGNIASFTAVNAGAVQVTALITVTPTANSCTGTPTTFQYIVNPTIAASVAMTLNTAVTICAGTNVTFTAHPTNGGGSPSYQWLKNASPVGTNSTTYSDATLVTNDVVSVTMTSNATCANPSVASSNSATFTVNPVPSVTTSNTATVCSGTSTNINLAATVASTFTWAIGTNTGGITGMSAGSGSNISQTLGNPSNSTAGSIVYNVTPTSTGGSCVGATYPITVTVNPSPVAVVPSNQAVCNGAAQSALTFTSAASGATFAWTNNTTSIGLGASGTGSSIGSFTATNATTAPVVATVSVTATANSCVGAAVPFTITVNPTPNVVVPSTQTVCNAATQPALSFSSSTAGTTYTWSNNTPSIGLAATGTGSIGAFTASNATSSPVTATVSVTPSANSCAGTPASFSIIVNPTPNVVVPSNQTLCNNATQSALTFSSSTTGTTYTWSNNTTSIGLGASGTGSSIGAFTATNATASPITATISVTPTANGCAGTPVTFTITVNPTPNVILPSNQTVCNGTTQAALTFSSSTTGTTYSWTNNTTSIGLGASGTGSSIGSFTATNALTTAVTATISVTPTANTCVGSASTFTITVNPTPTVVVPANQTVCNNAVQGALTFSGNIGTTTYNWTNNTPSINLGASGTGSIGSFTAINATSSPIVATITVTPTVNGCSGTPSSFTITVNPTPSVNGVSDQAVCAGSATSPVVFTGSSVAGTVYNWTNNNTSVGLAASGNGSIGSFTASNAGVTPAIANIVITPVANGCSGTTTTYKYTVNPIPNVSSVSNQTVCNNNTTTAVSFSGSVSGTVFTWSNNAPSIGLAASGTGSIAAFTATNATNVPVVASITVTPGASGCFGTPQTFTITVNPTPSVSSVSNQTVCNNTATASVVFSGSSVAGTVYNWTNNTPSIGLLASGTGSIGSFTATNGSTSPVIATVTVTPIANGCTGASQTFTITVNPTPNVVVPANQVDCNNATQSALTFSSGVSGTTYSWTNTASSIGLAATGTGNIGSFTATNATAAPVVATISVTPSANSCAGTPQSFTITVNPTPNLTVPSNQTVCNGTTQTALTFSSTTSGTTFSWTNNTTSIGLGASGTGSSIGSFTATNATSSPVTATITVTPSANGCAGSPLTFTITVNPTPLAVVPSNQTDCNAATQAALTFSSTTAGTTFAWSNNTTSIGLGASGTGSSIGSFTATNITTAPVTATVTVTPTANSCPGLPQTFTITVNPTPNAVVPSNQTVCNGTTQAALTFSSGVSGTTYSWTNNTTSIGLGASGTGSSIGSFTATNATASPVTATVTVTPSANGCAGTPVSFTITVNPTPIATVPSPQTVCNNATQGALSFTSTTAGTTFTWTNSQPTIGIGASGSGSSIGSFTATNATFAPVVANIVVTPSANSCVGNTSSFTITVNPTPNAIVPSNQSLCNGAVQSALTFSSGVTGTTYSWSNNTTSIGLGASGTGSSIGSFTATNATASPVTATVTVTPSANGCPGTPSSFTITVNPTPVVSVPSNQTVCNGTAQSALTFTSTTPGTTFSWTNNTPSIGLGASGSGSSIGSFTATNATSAPVTATISVTPSANGCTGAPLTFTITVNPTPVAVVPSNQTVCNGATQSALTFSSATTGTTFSWTNNTTSIGLGASGTGSSIGSFTATNVTTAPVTALISVTPTANSCIGTPATFNITVNPTPNAVVPSNQTVCNGATQSALSFSGGVSGTTYTWTNNTPSIGLASSGSGSSIGSFTAANATTAPVTATIVVTPNANGCNGPTQSFTIVVNPTPVLTSALTAAQCSNTAFTYTATSATTGTVFAWTRAAVAGINNAATAGGSSINETLVDTTTSPFANVVATYAFTLTANGCTNNQNVTDTVKPLPTLTSTLNPSGICSGTTFSYTPTSGVANTTFTWSRAFNGNFSNPATSGNLGAVAEILNNITATTQNATYVYVLNAANGCSNPFNYNVVVPVFPTPTLSSTLTPTAVCSGTSFNYAATSAASGVSFSWSRAAVAGISGTANGTGDVVNDLLVNTTSSNIVVTYQYTLTANSCVNVQNVTVTVKPTPSLSSSAGPLAQCTGSAVSYTATSPLAGTTFAWNRALVTGITPATANSSNGTIGETLTNSTTNPLVVTYAFTLSNPNGCSSNQNILDTVYPKPTVNSSLTTQAVCSNNPFAYTPTSATSGATFTWSRALVANITPATGAGTGTIGETLVNSGTAPATVTYVIQTNYEGCSNGLNYNLSVIVNPTPVLSSSLNPAAVCSGVALGYTATSLTSGTTFAWSRAATAGISNAANTGTSNPNNEILIDTTSTSVSVPYVYTLTANTCVNTQTVTATVNPKPVLTSALIAPTIFNSTSVNYTPTSNVAGTTFAWSRALVAGITPSTSTGTGSIGETLSNSTANPLVVTYAFTLNASGCTNIQNVTDTVLATPVLSSPLTATVCSSSPFSYTPTSSTAGTTFSWTRNAVAGISNAAASGVGSIGETLVDTTGVAVVVPYVYTLTANGASNTQTVNVTVKPQPALTSAAIANTICSGTAVSYTATSTVAGTSFTWSRALVAGITPATGTANNGTIGETLTNTTTAPLVVTYVFNMSVNGCTNTQNVTDTVNPKPVLSSALIASTTCSGSQVSYTPTSATTGATFTWSRANVAGITPSTSTGAGSIGETLTNSTSSAIVVTYAITTSANGCSNTQNVTDTIKPTPNVAAVSNQTRCNGANTAAITFTGSAIAGTVYTWTNDQTSIGLAASGTGSSIGAFVATNTTASPVIANLTVTASASGCTGATQLWTITVNPTPTLSSSTTPNTSCSGSLFTYTPTSATAGTTFTWSRSAVANITPTSSTGTGSIGETLNNAVTSNIPVTYVYTLSANGCTNATTYNIVDTVKPAPSFSVSNAPASICNKSVYAITLSSNIPGAVFTWNRAAVAGISNTAATGTGSPNEILNNTTTNPISVTYIYTVASTAGCTNGNNYAVSVTVKPFLVTTSQNNVTCNGGSNGSASVTPSAGVFPYTYSWSPSGGNLSTAAGLSAGTYTCTITDNTGCTLSPSVTITQPSPIAGPSSQSNVTCFGGSNGSATVVAAGGVAPYTYSWSPSGGNAATASGLTAGIYSCTVMDANSCVVVITDTITQPAQMTATPASQTVCNGSATTAITFNGGGTSYSWTNNLPSIGIAANGTGNISSFTASNAGSVLVTDTITVTPLATGCVGTPAKFTISVNPSPSVTTPTNQSVCNGATASAVNFTGSSVTGTTYSWTGTTSSIGLAISGNGSIGAFTVTNAGSTAIIDTITVTPLANGCTGAPKKFTITANPTPTVNQPSSQTVCVGNLTTVNFSGAVAGTSFGWVNTNNAAIGIGASGLGNISFTAANSNTTALTANITVTPSANGCNGAFKSFSITVNPNATVNAIANQTICTGTNTTAVNFSSPVSGTTYTWSGTTAAIGLAASGSGNGIASFTGTNATTSVIIDTITVTPTANGCTGTPLKFTITVNPVPTVANPGNQLLCAGNATSAINFSGTVTGTTFTWSNSGSLAIGLGQSGTGNIASFITTNAGSTVLTANVSVTPTINGCPGTPQAFTITVNPIPVATVLPAAQTVCNGAATTAITFTSNVTGTTFAWTNNASSIGLSSIGAGSSIGSFTATNTGVTPVIATISVTPTANGCNGLPQVSNITVNPTPNMTQPGNQTVCNGAPTTLVTFSPTVAGSTFSWTNNTTSIGLGSTGTGSTIPVFTATNVTTSPVTATIVVTPSANGCSGAVNAKTFTITVNPTPNVAAVSNQTVCNGSATTAVVFTGGVAGTVFNWNNGTSLGGLAAGTGTGNIGSFIATNATPAPITSTITVTPTANGCTGPQGLFTITVNPTPVLTSSLTGTVCSNTPFTYTPTSSTTGATYSWTRASVTNITPATASGTGSIGETLVNSTSAPIVVNYVYTVSANSCTNPSTFTVAVTVKPTPSVTALPASQSVCNGAATTAVTFSGPVSGTTYTWSNNTTSIGLAASGSGSAVGSFTATNPSTAPVTATINVTPSANACSGTTVPFTITVNPTPNVTILPASQTVCNNTSTAAIAFSGAVSGTTYSWTNNTTSIGLGSAGNGSSITSFVASNLTNAAVTATINVIPSANGCSGTQQSASITVNPTPTVNAVSNQTVCNGTATAPVSLTGSGVSGTTYSWTNNTTSIGLAASGTGNIGSFTATNATFAPVTATIVATPAANGCNGATMTFTITVNPVPQISGVINNQTVCNNQSTTAVNFTATVAGSVFSWTNSNTAIGLAASGTGNVPSFVGTNAGVLPIFGNLAVTPTYTNNAVTCTGNVVSWKDTVNPILAPSVTISANTGTIICLGTSVTFTATPTNGGSNPQYQWKKNGLNVGTNSATYTDNGLANNDAITCVMTTSVPCPTTPTATSNTVTMTVNSVAASVSIASNAPSNTICAGTSVTFTATPTNGGPAPTYQWKKNALIVGTNSATYTDNGLNNNDVITCIMSSNATCATPNASASNAITMTVNPILVPSITIAPNPTGAICAGTSVTFTATPTNGGTSPAYQWKKNGSNVGGGLATYTDNSLNNSDIITCVLTSNAICASTPTATSNADTMIVNPVLTPSVALTFNTSNTICAGTSVTFTATPTNGGPTPSYQWKKNGNNVGTNSTTYVDNGLNTGDVITVVMTSNATCVSPTTVGSNSATMTVIPLVPASVTISSNAPANTICAGTSVTFTAVGTNAGVSPVYQWKKNGVNVGTGTTYTDNTLNNNDSIICVLTSSITCASPVNANSNKITMTVNPLLTPSILISASSTNICAGTNVTFTASFVSNGGTNPQYQWKKNGSNVGTNSSTYTDNGLANGDQISCVMTSNALCATPTTVTSINTITMTVNPVLTPLISITANPGTTICANTPVTFTAAITNGGSTPAYQWKKNGVNVGAGLSTYTNAALANGDIITCVLTSNATCAAPNPVTSNADTMIVNGLPTITSVVSSPVSGAICAGSNITITATASGAGLSYQWYNSLGQLTNNSTFSGVQTNVLTISNAQTNLSGTGYYVIVSGTCTPPQTSSTVTITVNAPPSINTNGQPKNDTVCAGVNGFFTVNASGAGLQYKWYTVNGSTYTQVSNGALYSGALSATLNVLAPPSTLSGTVYKCIITGTCLPLDTTNAAVLIVDTLPAIITQPATTSLTICEGSTTTIGITAVGTGLTYQWTANGSNITASTPGAVYSGFNSNTLTITGATAGLNGTVYNCVISGTCGPTKTSNNDTLHINLLPFISAGGQPQNDTVCAGNGASYHVTGGGAGVQYQWWVNTGSGYSQVSNGGIYSGATTSTLNISSTTIAMSGYKYRVHLTGTCNPVDTSNFAVLIVDTLPSITTQPVNTTVCATNNTTISVGAIGTGLHYQWYLGAAPISNNLVYGGATTANLTITGATLGMNGNTYHCNITGTCGSLISTNTVTLTVNSLPTATATPGGPLTFCPGDSVVLSANSGTGLSYQWQFNNVNITPGGNSITYAAKVAGTYNVIVTNANNCSVTSNTITVVTFPAPPAAITAAGPTTFCQGGNVTLNANTGTGISYYWKINGIYITNATSSSYTATTSGVYTVYEYNGTCYTTSAPVTVTVNPLPAATITYSGNGTFCQGDSLLLHASVATGNQYVWFNNGVVISGATNSTYWATISGNYTVTVTSAASCTATSSIASITSVPAPAASITAGGPTNICSGSSVSLYANTGIGLSYQWYMNGVAIPGATNSVYTDTASGTFAVKVSNSASCSVISAGTTVTVTPSPIATVIAGGPTTFCQGDSVTLFAYTATGYTYQWQKNNVDISGATNSTYTDTASGSFTVIVHSGSCTAVSVPVVVNGNSLPPAVVTVSNAHNVICFGSNATLQVPAISGYSYQWAFNGVDIPSANAPYIGVTDSGNYTVRVSNGSGCSITTQAIHMSIDSPIHPVIVANGAELCTGNTYALYQWYNGGTAVTFANAACYYPPVTGSFTVTVTDSLGCSNSSDVFTTRVKTVVSAQDIRLYPNPATSVLNIDAPVAVNVTITSLQGTIVMKQDNAKTMDITPLANGVYMIQVYDKENALIKTERLVKNNW